jgi:hypothetical protein
VEEDDKPVDWEPGVTIVGYFLSGIVFGLFILLLTGVDSFADYIFN